MLDPGEVTATRRAGRTPGADDGSVTPGSRSRSRGSGEQAVVPEGQGSLSHAPPGSCLRVEAIMFDDARIRCRARGIVPNIVLRCMAWLPDAILVELPDGETARVHMETADFICVRPVREDGPGV